MLSQRLFCSFSLLLLAEAGITDGLVPAEWNDENIIVQKPVGWVRIPETKPEDPKPHPPQKHYHEEAVADNSSIVILIASLRETKIVENLKELFQRAAVPSRVIVGVVQQNSADDADVVVALCEQLGTPLELKQEFKGREKLNRRQSDEDKWGQTRYTDESMSACGPAKQIRMYRMDNSEAKGPAYARARQPLLLTSGDGLEDFCMQIDAHTVWTKGWDKNVIEQWAKTENDYAVLSTYPTNAAEIGPDGDPTNTNNHWEMPHLCNAQIERPGIVRNDIAGAAAGLTKPALSKLWGAGLSFSRCHAERDVPADPALTHIFSGEEFSRGARLWTNGYDLYTLMRPVVGTWYGGEKGGLGGWHTDSSEASAAVKHLATLLSTTAADRSDQDSESLRGYDIGGRRSLQQYIDFTGVDTINGAVHPVKCVTEKWTAWKQGAQEPYGMLDGSPVKLGTAFVGTAFVETAATDRSVKASFADPADLDAISPDLDAKPIQLRGVAARRHGHS